MAALMTYNISVKVTQIIQLQYTYLSEIDFTILTLSDQSSVYVHECVSTMHTYMYIHYLMV